MKNLIVSYSFTGNNGQVAKGLAEKIGADYVQLQEERKRSILTIVLDVIFKRTPSIRPLGKDIGKYDCVIFVAPIWFGKIATPFRHLFSTIKNSIQRYAFVSVSAGSNGIVPHVEPELIRYLGTGPVLIASHLISDLVPYEQRSNRKLLDAYSLSKTDTEQLVDQTALKIENSVK